MTLSKMYSRRSTLYLLTLALPCVVAPRLLAGQSNKPITREGLEKALKLNGLKPSELVSILDQRGVDFILNPEIEGQLRKLGATQAVIEAVGRNYRGVDGNIVEGPPSRPAQPPPNPTPVAPRPVPVPGFGNYPVVAGVYLREGNSWVALRQESTSWHNEGFMRNLKKASGGLIDAEATGEVPGDHSSIAAHSPATILVRPESGLAIEDYLCVHMHGKHDDREFKIAPNALHSKDSVELQPTSLGGGLYQIDFAQGEGDYGFVSKKMIPAPGSSSNSAFVYTFRILP